ncbi:hypothetical protein FNV43_RR19066 [Rhamnella rubrinervis]|uniref:Uncharacterized protein n=1 Tax=Rhamnella rubrinervis TaxID=2594499 RepID=A0A8K0E0H4_9ROSA|nr:hypothetical protein FNV43_RR19066 [Rhamnella rubrinervis]
MATYMREKSLKCGRGEGDFGVFIELVDTMAKRFPREATTDVVEPSPSILLASDKLVEGRRKRTFKRKESSEIGGSQEEKESLAT